MDKGISVFLTEEVVVTVGLGLDSTVGLGNDTGAGNVGEVASVNGVAGCVNNSVVNLVLDVFNKIDGDEDWGALWTEDDFELVTNEEGEDLVVEDEEEVQRSDVAFPDWSKGHIREGRG